MTETACKVVAPLGTAVFSVMLVDPPTGHVATPREKAGQEG